jgi:hypothetical protein
MSAPRAAGATDRPLVLANLSRRGFLQGMTVAGGFVLAAGFTSAARAADPPKYGADGMPNGWVDDPLGWSSSPSRPTASSASRAIGPRWARACGPACR